MYWLLVLVLLCQLLGVISLLLSLHELAFTFALDVLNRLLTEEDVAVGSS